MAGGGAGRHLSRHRRRFARRLYPFFDRRADRRERAPASRRANRPRADRGRSGAARRRLKWEKSRGGALFPHLYGALDPAEAASVRPLPLGPDGEHVFPPLDP
jgi:hypothetical protein